MTEPNPPSRHSTTVRVPVLMGLFAGTAVGAGYLLAGIPNVELMSLVAALGGVALGPARGAVVGALAAGVFSLASPYGLPAPLLLAAQMAGLGTAGVAGAVAGRRGRAVPGAAPRRSWRSWPLAALAGLVVTVVYDGLTNLAILASFDFPAGVVLAGALPFFLVHMATNVAFFAVIFPNLAPRLVQLGSPRVTGRAGIGTVIAVATAVGAWALCATPSAVGAGVPVAADSLAWPAPTAADSLGPPALPASRLPHGWKRQLWEPFTPTFLAWAERDSPWLTYVDGGIGAAARLVGEAGAASSPLIVRDGVPLGTGHVLADDLWLVGREGVAAQAASPGFDGWGGTSGLVNLSRLDVDPVQAVSSYRGIKGRHESYYRGVDLLSSRSDWRLGFSFEESLDNEGYNHTTLDDESFAELSPDGFTGEGKVRQSRTRIERLLPQGSVSVEFSSGRLTRDELPALAAGHLEAWDRNAAVRMRWLSGPWDLRPVLFWNERDVQWGPRWVGATPPASLRLLESGRQGLRVDVRRAAASTGNPDASVETGPFATPAAPPLLSVSATSWALRDNGTRLAWAGADTVPVTADSGELRVALGGERVLGGAVARLELGALGGGGLGVGPDARLALAPAGVDPRWEAAINWGGRAPRSDELWTPLRQSVAGRDLAVLPNAGLEREKSLRAEGQVRARAAGLDLAVGASLRHLTDGIHWIAQDDDPDRGRWANGLEMRTWRLTAAAAREGRFAGWLRLKGEGTWQGFDVAVGPAGPLPPGNWQRLRLDWENHFFKEDGILQVSLVTTRRAAGNDPWDLTGTVTLPVRVNHDLLVGFRLVGAHLVLGLRNLAGDQQRLTSGALSPGREMDMRLEWAFRQ
ncbi:MAG: ECF transporter S component [bacterium]|nr:ECF transporter S component [bacterium]